MDLHLLAPELLDHIFRFACTDGGQTGAALACVSSHVRATSRAARFYSVALISADPSQLHAFLTLLRRERVRAGEGLAPKVRHLCLASASYRPPPAPVPSSETDGADRPSMADAEECRRRIVEDITAARVEWEEAAATLLALAAPDLYTLSLAHGFRGGKKFPPELLLPSHVVCPSGFPYLRELTITGPAPIFEWDEGEGDGADPDSGRVMFPSLERLHFALVSTAAAQGLELLGWPARAPRLTHLRVSHVNYWPKAIVDALATALPSVELQQLTHIIVEPHAAPPMGGYCGTPHLVWESFVDRLARTCAAAGSRAALLPCARDMRRLDWLDVARHAWGARVRGDAGAEVCWDVPASGAPAAVRPGMRTCAQKHL